MKLEDIVCDFEYAEKLRELGLDKKTLFKYGRGNSDDWSVMGTFDHCWQWLRTYTVAELGEMILPDIDDYFLFSGRTGEDDMKFMYSYDHFENRFKTIDNVNLCPITADKKEANARAKLLIWLIENKHINVGETNE